MSKTENLLHTAICQAVASLNQGDEPRLAHTILRQALVDYADSADTAVATVPSADLIMELQREFAFYFGRWHSEQSGHWLDATACMENECARARASMFCNVAAPSTPSSSAEPSTKVNLHERIRLLLDGVVCSKHGMMWEDCCLGECGVDLHKAISGLLAELAATPTKEAQVNCWHCGVVLVEIPELRCGNCPDICDLEGCTAMGHSQETKSNQP